jgi:hypothetical protein
MDHYEVESLRRIRRWGKEGSEEGGKETQGMNTKEASHTRIDNTAA